MKELKSYIAEDGTEWEIYTREQGFWRHYYMAKVERYGFPSGVPKNIKFAFSISKEHDYNGKKNKVIQHSIENFAERNRYTD